MAGRADHIDTTDGVDLAMGRASGSAEAKSLLERQSLLIQAQETLAKADLRHRGWQIISERVGAALKALTALAGILLLAGIASFLWSASRASGMVVDAFSVPRDLERQGLNGAVVAKQLLDKVVALERETQSARAKSSYEDSFSDTQGVVVPYAGVSLGQMRREMRDWLGSETHLGGEMVRLPGRRLAISFRTTNGLSGRVEGPDGEPDRLLEQAALAMFKSTQPYRYAVYQSRRGNEAEAVATLQALSRSDNLRERLWAMHGLALNAPTQDETVAIYRRVLALDPNFLSAIGNMPLYALEDGREEEGLKGAERSAAAYAKGADDYTRSYATGFGLDSESTVAALKGDLLEAARLAEAAEQTQGGGPTFLASRPFQTARAHAAVHDFTRARETLAAAGFLDPERRAAAERITGSELDLAGLRAMATGDDAALVAAYQRMLAALGVEKLDSISLGEAADSASQARAVKLAMAPLLARLRRTDEAEAAIAGMALSNDRVLRARALVAAHRGDHRRSDALFARAVARTPSLPAAHYAWAEAKMLRRDYLGTIEQARLAHRKGPRWAEPLKLWGDVLYALGKSREAAERYALAADRAPRWGQLHIRWAAALWAGGDRRQAREKLGLAAGMDLSDSDRERLRAMLKAASRV